MTSGPTGGTVALFWIVDTAVRARDFYFDLDM